GWRRRQLLKLPLEDVKIDGFGDEIRRTLIMGHAAALLVPIRRYHHHREFRPTELDLTQKRQPIHARHINVRQDDDQLRPYTLTQHLESCFARLGEVHDVGALPDFTPKLLAKKFGNVGLVIHDEDTHAHHSPPA